MAKLLLTLTAKDFVTGIAQGAHSDNSGLFYKADGITPIAEPGTDQSPNNFLLMPGGAPTIIGGSLGGAIIGGYPDNGVHLGSGGYFFAADNNHIYALQLATDFSTAIADLHTISGHTLTPGIICIKTASGSAYLLYRQVDQIGQYDGATFTDNWQSMSADYFGALHAFGYYVYAGNGLGVVARFDDALALTASALLFYKDHYCSAISDDGTYVILAITDNQSADPSFFSSTRILFWDGFSTNTWLREYRINDPFIFKLEKTPFGVFAYGVTGIWQVSFGGVKKVFSRAPGIYTKSGASSIHYGNGATSYYVNALLWGGSSGSNKVIKAFGALDLSVKNALIHPFLSTAGKNVTFLDGLAIKGYVLVGDDTPQLKAYPFNGAGTLQEGNSAQIIYVQLPQPAHITAIRAVFGEPLAPDDEFAVSVYTDEDTAPSDFGSVAYDASKTIRSKTFKPLAATPKAEDSISPRLTFTAGAVKVKKIQVYGDPLEPNDA